MSTQVLQEYFVKATGKLRLPADEVRARVEQLAQLEVVLVRPDLILGAIDLHRLSRISFWDALIVRCASAAGCGRLLTEDLNHGQLIDGVRIENPFASTGGKAKELSPSWRVTRPAGRASASGSSRRRGSRPARTPRPRG